MHRPFLHFLLGPPASGKSSLGQQVAEKLDYNFIDLDDWIEQREGQAITHIFNGKGEAIFREKESEALRSLALLPAGDYIIACGGGTPCFMKNMDWIQKHGPSIYLKLTPQTLKGRLQVNKSRRPLVTGLSNREIGTYIRSLLEEREFFYNQATHILKGKSVSVSAIIAKIAEIH